LLIRTGLVSKEWNVSLFKTYTTNHVVPRQITLPRKKQLRFTSLRMMWRCSQDNADAVEVPLLFIAMRRTWRKVATTRCEEIHCKHKCGSAQCSMGAHHLRPITRECILGDFDNAGASSESRKQTSPRTMTVAYFVEQSRNCGIDFHASTCI
jgi:hypothetical protein